MGDKNLEFLRALTETTREAGCPDTEKLGRQLLVLFEGATALTTSLDDPVAFDYARSVAITLIDARG